MSSKKGIKHFKERALAAIVKDYKQQHDMNTFVIVCPQELMPKNKRDALSIITLTKEKRTVKIKEKECANYMSQRAYITKEESTAPTVSIDALLAQLIIDTFEERAMTIFEVPSSYPNSDVPEDKFVLLKIENDFVDIMCEVKPEFVNDVQQEGNKRCHI